ncbi:type II secretion system protein M, partial [Candidatus Poribacteria bacterium]|nr:type II secretion system protein M [Candidatus Poribacteria bacterium]
MKKLTTREKVFLGIGILAIVIIFAYLLVWPMFQKNRTNSRANIQEMQNKLNSLGKLGSMASTLGELEDRMKTQVGYKEAAFRRGIADSMIIKYVSQAAS